MPDAATPDIFRPPSDTDPETGLPVIALPPAIADAFITIGWRVVPTNVEDMYVEHDFVLDHIDPDGRAISALGYSIEPSGNEGGLIVHRGDDCNGPVFIMRPHTPGGIPPVVVVAAVAALKVHDTTEIGRPCPAGGLVTVLDRVIPDGDDLLGTYDATCSTCGTVGQSMIRHQAEALAASHRQPERDPADTVTGGTAKAVLRSLRCESCKGRGEVLDRGTSGDVRDCPACGGSGINPDVTWADIDPGPRSSTDYTDGSGSARTVEGDSIEHG